MGLESKTRSDHNERELLLAALEKEDPNERKAFLDAACGSNTALRQNIESLLNQKDHIGNFMDTPAIAGLHSTPITEKPGDRIGRYKLLQQIGEGGAGVVYMAEQEQPVRRRVALKIIKLGMDTPAVIARFEAERQALAMMDHPNIARVFDAGTTETGRPYFVMELVQGVRITEYCDRTKMPPGERLSLFILVCRAIQHAHQKGIIHRDIKPSNILITLNDGMPVPKVIDFGIAKAMHQRLTDKTVFTQFATFIGTPAYMSPEQAQMSGLDIDTRADIYALGVLLYELLTGKTPFEAEALYAAGIDECRRTIREVEPLRPSLRLSSMPGIELTTAAGERGLDAPKLVSVLSGDLDWIVLKCLEKDRTRRYETATSLALDVQNYLDDKPILARPPSNIYLLKKMLHRHRNAFAAATAIGVSLLAGITISTYQAIRASRAEKEESIQRQLAFAGETSARLNEYVADINLVQRSLAAGNYGRAVQLLNKHRPEEGKTDLRGFEWRYLWQLSQGDPHTPYPTQQGPVQSLTFSPNGDLLVVGVPDKFTVYDTRQRTLLHTVSAGAVSASFSADSKSLFTAQPPFIPTNFWMFGRGMMPGGGDPRQDGRNMQRGRRPRGGRGEGPGGPFGGGNFGPGWQGGGDFGRDNRNRGPGGFGFAASPSVRIWNTTDWTERKSLPGNSGPIVLSKDGTRLATTIMNGEGVRLLDTTSWMPINLPMGNSFEGRGPFEPPRGAPFEGRGPFERGAPFDGRAPMAFSPDGKILATDSGAGVKLWYMDGRRAPVILPNSTNLFFNSGPEAYLRPSGAMIFSPDGKYLVATRNMLSEHGIFVLGIWDVESGRETTMPEDPEHIEHTGAISALAFSPDGQILATASMDYSIRLWDFAKRQRLATLQGHLSEVWALAFSPDGTNLVSGAKDGTVKWWPVSRQEKEDVFPGSWQDLLAVSKDSRKLAVQGRQGTLVFLNATNGEPEQEFRGRFRFATPVALSADFRTIAQVREDGRVQVWNTEDPATNILDVAERQISYLALSPDARWLITSGGFVRGFRCWDLLNRTNRLIEGELARALFSPDGRTLAVFQQTNHVQIWDVAKWSLRTSWICDAGLREGAVAFSPDGKILAAGCSDDIVYLWDTTLGKEVGFCIGHKQGISSVAFSPDGETIASSSDDRTVKLWHVATQQELLTLRHLGGTLRGLLFSPDGTLLVGRISTISAKPGLRYYRAPQFSEIDFKE